MSTKRKFVADGVFYAELNELRVHESVARRNHLNLFEYGEIMTGADDEAPEFGWKKTI